MLPLGPSNSVVEKGFSQLTTMLSDRRLSMKPITMENLMIIKVNHLTWSPEERDEIIERALEIYMQKKRRKMKLDVTPFNMIGVVQGKKKRISSSESENESSSSGSDVVVEQHSDEAEIGWPLEASQSQSDDHDLFV